MNTRIASLLGTTIYAADKVEPITIDLLDPISMIQIFYSAMNQAPLGGVASNLHPAGCITKIEMVDGSDVLWSLNGFQTQALDFYHNKRMPYHDIRYANNNYSHSVYQLNFGRWLYDEALAFDPKKYANPKLNISIDIDAGGCNCDAGRMEVLAHIFDEKAITPTGYLMAKEAVSYTLANNAHEYIDLPTDLPIRKLFISPRRPGTQPDVQLAHVKLTQDGDKKVIIDQDIRNLIAILESTTPPCEENIIGAGAAAAWYFGCMPSHQVRVFGNPWRNAASGYVAFYEGDGGRFQNYEENVGQNWQAQAKGWCPHCAIELPFGVQDVIEEWFTVPSGGSFKADITAGAAVGVSQTCQVFLQQLRTN